MRSKLLTCALAFILLFGGASVAGADNANLVVGDNNTVVFIDVGKEWQWARDSICYFAEQGIVNGVGDGRFAPGQKVTRTNKYGKSATIVKQVTYKPEAGADE